MYTLVIVYFIENWEPGTNINKTFRKESENLNELRALAVKYLQRFQALDIRGHKELNLDIEFYGNDKYGSTMIESMTSYKYNW